jgi:rRNA maturation RNase YbeY
VSIDFIYDDDSFKIFDESKVLKWINEVAFAERKFVGEITYQFVTEETILDFNIRFLNHTYFTDIITFDNSLVNIINGDIIISFDTVQSNADKFGVSFESELYRVIIHGVIHLCGYADSTEIEKKVMREKENQYLSYLEKL